MNTYLAKLLIILIMGFIGLTSLGVQAQDNPLDVLRQGQATIRSIPSAIQPAGTVRETVDRPVASEAGTTAKGNSSFTFERNAGIDSDVFGANLFTGKFIGQSPGRFNPEYTLMIGDQVQIRLWGGFEYSGTVEVDPQGNIFLPHVGPVNVLGIRNQDLQSKVETSIRKIFRANVSSYASLAAPQPVRVFVGGFVRRPGLYNGTSMDSLLSYLDQAGGIDPDRGSFLNVQVKRGERVRAMVNLYEFLLEGRIPLVQLAEGDVIFVQPRQFTVKVSGLVSNANRFEFSSEAMTVADLMRIAKPKPEATHVRVVRNTGEVVNTEYYALSQAREITLQNGDSLEFTADKKPGTITVRVEGEHKSAQEYVLPYGARLGDLMRQIELYPSSDAANLQLFRQSVRERQKLMLNAALKNLETSVLTARSATNEESRLRKDEADLILQWVERARKVEPTGQVIVAKVGQRDELLLENGDILRIPKQDGLVLINGEVAFPNAVAFDPGLSLHDYIRRAGGYAQSADTSRIIVAHRDGSFEEADGETRWFGNGGDIAIKSGDEILVLPKVQTKSIEVTRGISQIIYQMAIATKVILGL